MGILDDFVADQQRRHPGHRPRKRHKRGRPRNFALGDVERQAVAYLAETWDVPVSEVIRQCLRAVLGCDFNYQLTRQCKLKKGAYFLEPDKAPELPYREVLP